MSTRIALALGAAWVVVALLANCYHGNPPWPGDPTAPAAKSPATFDGGTR